MQRFKLFLVILLTALATNIYAASSDAVSMAPTVVFETSQGNFTVELYPEKAPKTVANFLQ